MGGTGSKLKKPMKKRNLDPAESSDEWREFGEHDNGYFKLARGMDWVSAPKRGEKGLRVSSKPAIFEINKLKDGNVSIKMDNKYVFAGNQATVKWPHEKLGNWESFWIYIKEVGPTIHCTIQCERDEERWYVDQQGYIRHRKSTELGNFAHEFQMIRVRIDK